METPLYRLDWLRIAGNGHTDPSGVQWILTEEKGFWDAPGTRSTVVERTNTHGSYISPVYKTERVITMTGRAYCDDVRRLRRAWSQLAGLGADPEALLTLACDSRIGTQETAVRLDGAIETMPVQLLNTHAMEFSLQLVAPDPRKYSAEITEMRAELPQATTGDGLDFADMDPMSPSQDKGLAFPLVFGESNATGFLQLINSGTAPTCPIYTFHGPLTEPVLTATTGGAKHLMRYNDSLTEGQTLVVDPSIPSVALGGTASRRHLLNPADFAGFYIPAASTDSAGRLGVGLTHSGAVTTGGHVAATFRDAWF